ncbi:Transcriptional activator protein CzcR [Methyloligella halotolerans]|uniref:Transcriptional activator protein CzcR n=1 Tax=Methyloligella halotolerans TaxID=1177755 RepID=A0A1E2RUV2_9HYPH|nr:response regulator transcription factor [Methyloligella halotolerans]ODA66027.1 Transcriptional activator protein CzcR [Methyloligella halotolerans]
MRILVVEDDEEAASLIIDGLSQARHSVDLIANGRDGLVLGIQEEYDLIILDRMLPGLDGLSVAKSLRSSQIVCPILFLTALSSINDRVQGLEVGGDDYLVKPFAISELLARVNALARRPPMRAEDDVLRAGDLELNTATRSVTRQTSRIDLLPREFALLEVLLQNKGRVVTRTMLLERVWGLRFEPKTSVIETHISRLRAKVDRDPFSPLIRTVRGSGYCVDSGE